MKNSNGTDDIKKKAEPELRKLLDEKREALRVFRFALAGSRTRNVREGRMIKKERARIETELRSRR